ncbi:MAG: ECF transporter S component [Clostridia bacterium]|nr:ECF transporter S component [Clostridia bacterium]
MTIRSEKLRTVLRFAIPFVLIPVLAVLGETVFDEKKHLFVSLAVAVLSLILFYTGFEQKKIGTRRMVIVAVMVALSGAGRFIPLFKPVAAITVITAIWLGGEAGFLVGSLSALLFNFYFGQGPWTPFQMLAWGIIGLVAGFLAEPLKKSRIALVVYGVGAGIAYSFIMDVWTVLGHYYTFNLDLYFAALATAVPYTVTYAVSNAFFLWLMAKPFGEKLARVKIKYGV